ncbi:hypothetical protein VTI28DRAFT_2305 [Corynascus sepedonium]
MPVSLKIEPADFVVPPGPAIIFVKIDREALQHLNPSMIPLSDADSPSAVLRKGKGALEYVRRQLSDILFGDDVPRAAMERMIPHPGFSATPDSEPLLRCKYIGFYWKRHIVARESFIAVVNLESEPHPVDNHLVFHAVEEVDEDRRARVVHGTFDSEDRMEAWKAEMEAQAQAQAQAETSV